MNNPIIFDRGLKTARRARHHDKFKDHDFLFKWAANQIEDRLSIVNRKFPDALQIDARAPHLDQKEFGIEEYFILDERAVDNQIKGSEEFLPFGDNTLDLITSSMALQSTNDLVGALIQIKRALKPDGLFTAAMAGGETLIELRTVMQQAEMEIYGGISPRIYPFADIKQVGAVMQRAGFALPVIDSEKVIVSYSKLETLLHDLRYMGEGNNLMGRNTKPLSRKFWERVSKLYFDQFNEGGTICATFEIIFMHGWKPHESQQKPMKPGSADTHLSEVLN